jgi:dTDP-4-dehydrorhamnose reductase
MLALAAEKPFVAVVDDQVGSPTSTHDLAPLLWRFVQRRPPWGIWHATNAGHQLARLRGRDLPRSGLAVDLRRMSSRDLRRPPRARRARC